MSWRILGITGLLLSTGACRGGVSRSNSLDHSHRSLVDDFRPRGVDGEDWGRSRFDTARTFLGSVNYDGDVPILNAGSMNGALRYTLPMRADQVSDGLSLDQLLGETLSFDVQPTLVGIEVVLNGSGALEARLEGPDGNPEWTQIKAFNRSDDRLVFDTSDAMAVSRVGTLGFDLIRGFVEIRRVELLLEERRLYETPLEEAFVFSYAQLSRCWDGAVGLMRSQCRPDDLAAVYGTDITGLFALATAVGSDLGYVPDEVAQRIVLDARDALLALPRDPVAGLLPDRTDGAGVAAGGQWSSLATVVAIEATILASQHFELGTDELVGVLEDLGWDELTTNGGLPVLAGYDERGIALDWRFGVFGSKSALLQVAHVGATGELAPMDLPFQPTWDGAGWDNELAALLFPMDGPDWVGNDWVAFRSGAHWQHHTWSRDTPAGDLGLFGLSTVEVPEPWALEPYVPAVSDYGVGGHNQFASDGLQDVGYSFYAPHYAALVVAEFPDTAGLMVETLLERNLLTPFNAVESVGVAKGDALRFNHHLRGFSLALQTLGLGRALSAEGYLPYRLLDQVAFLRDGHQTVLPEEVE